MTLLFLILALVTFLVATFNPPVKINLTALGLAFLTIGWLLPHLGAA